MASASLNAVALIFLYYVCISGPCDITGDISFEELRAKAYEEGRQGHPLQSIVSFSTPNFLPIIKFWFDWNSSLKYVILHIEICDKTFLQGCNCSPALSWYQEGHGNHISLIVWISYVILTNVCDIVPICLLFLLGFLMVEECKMYLSEQDDLYLSENIWSCAFFSNTILFTLVSLIYCIF